MASENFLDIRSFFVLEKVIGIFLVLHAQQEEYRKYEQSKRNNIL
jgi:hypothetical protein